MYTNTTLGFQVNDYIFHGGSGVCQVQDICIPKGRYADPSRTYYQLSPVYEQGSVIYTPTDCDTGIVRPILTKEEAMALIDSMPGLALIEIENEKAREQTFRTTLRTNNCAEWMRVIKTLYMRGEARKADGKKVGLADEKFMRMAEDLLYGELAVSLDMPKEEVQDFIAGRIAALEEPQAQCS